MPELGKATYVVEIDSRKFEKDLDRVEKRTTKSATKQDKAVSDMADSWTKATTGIDKTTEAVDRNERSVDKNRRTLKSLGRELVYVNQALSLLGKGFSLLKLPVIATGISVLVAAVGQLAGGIVALAGAMGPAAGAAATLGNAYLALGQVMGVLKLAGFDQLTKAMQGDKDAFKQLTPAAKKFGAVLKGLEGRFKGLKKAVQGELFPGLARGVKGAMQNFGRFKAAMSGMAGVVGDLAARFGQMLGSKSFGKLFGKVTKENEQVVSRLGRALIHLVPALFAVLAAARPLTDWLTKAALAWSKNAEMSAKAGMKSGELATFFEHTRQTLSKLWKLTSNFTHALVNLGSIGRQTGMDLFSHMNRAAKSFRSFTESAEGQNKIRAYFDRIKPGIVAMGKLLNGLTKAILDVGASGGMKKTADSLTRGLKPLTRIMKSLSRDAGPALSESLVQILRLFARLTKYTTPMITLALKGVGGLAKGINSLIQSNSILKRLATGLALVYAGMKALAIARFALQLSGLQKMWMLLTTSLFRTRLAYAGLVIQQKASMIWAAASSKAIGGLKSAMFALGNTAVVLRARLLAMAVIAKITTAFAAVRTAVLALSLTVRGAMLATGIGALIVGATLIVMNWDKVKVALAATWQWIKGAAAAVGKAVLWAIQHGLLGPIPLIISRWGEVKKVLGSVWSWVKEAAKKAWSGIKDGAVALFNFFKGAARKYFELITWPYRQTWKIVKSIFGAIIDAARKVVDWIGSNWESVEDVLVAPFRFVKHVVQSIFEWLADKFNWLMDKIEDAKNAISDIPGSIGDKIPDVTPWDGISPIGATGGMVTARGIDPLYLASGGMVGKFSRGPSGTDTVPAWLTPGEAVISKPAVDAAGGPAAMRAVNSGNVMGLDPGGVEAAVKRITSALSRLRATQKTTVFGMAGETEGRTRTMNEAIASNFVNGQRAAEKRADEMRKNVVDRIAKMEKAAHAKTKKMAKNTKDDAKKMKDGTRASTGAAEDSWESLGGQIDKFQKRAGKDLDKHKKDVKKNSGSISGLLGTLAGVAWVKYGDAVKRETDKGDKGIKGHRDKTKGFLSDLIGKAKDAVGGWLDYSTGTNKHMREVVKGSKNERNSVLESQGSMIDGVNNGLGILGAATNKALKALGVKPINFGVEQTKKDKPQKKQHGGILRAMKGAVVPGMGSGDTVPLHMAGRLVGMVEPGELVSINNRTSTAELMAHNETHKRKGVRKFASGGMVDPRGPGTGVVNAAIADEVGAYSVKYDTAVNYGYDPGDNHKSPGHNVTGTATDVGPAKGWGVEDALFESGLKAAVAAGLTVYYGSHGIGTPLENHGYGNHAHIEWTMNPPPLKGVPAGGLAQTVDPVSLFGPAGATRSEGQASLNEVLAAANSYLQAQVPEGSGSGAEGTGRGAADVNTLPPALAKYNQRYEPHWAPDYGGYVMPPDAIAALAEWAGKGRVPGWTMQQLTEGESGGRPGSAGVDPGGTKGYGLYAVTSPFNDALVKKYGGYPGMWNPVNASMAMAEIYPTGWHGGSPWYGDSHISDFDKHYTGPLLAGKNTHKGPKRYAKGGAFGFGDIRHGVNHYANVGQKGAKKPHKTAKKQKKILTKLLDQITGIEQKDGSFVGGLGGIEPGLAKKLGGLENKLLMYDENAQRASDVTSLLTVNGDPIIDPETGFPMQAQINGKTQVEWLQKKLDALWEMRNKLVRASKQIEKRKTAIEKLIKQSRRAYNNAMKKVAKVKKELEFEGKDPGEKYKGKLNPLDAAVGKWNAQKDAQREKLAKTFFALGGKLPGTRKFKDDFTIATPDTDPKMFKDSKLEQSKADTLKKLVLPALGRQLALTNGALPESWRTLADVQGSYADKDEIVKGPVSVPKILENYGGQLLETVLSIRELDPTNNYSVNDQTSEMLEMYKQIALEQTQRSTVLSAQMPVFNDFFGIPSRASNLPFGGVYHTGLDKGPIPGPRGSDVAIIAQAGEVVAQPDQMVQVGSSSASQEPVAVIIEDGAVDSAHIRTIFGEEAARAISNSRRRIGH